MKKFGCILDISPADVHLQAIIQSVADIGVWLYVFATDIYSGPSILRPLMAKKMWSNCRWS